MPSYIDIEAALLNWQAKYNRRLTYNELAEMVGVSITVLSRMTSGTMILPDLRRINQLCSILECHPSDVIRQK